MATSLKCKSVVSFKAHADDQTLLRKHVSQNVFLFGCTTNICCGNSFWRIVQYSPLVEVVKVVIQVVQLVRVVQVVNWWMWDVSVKQHKAFIGVFAYHYRHLEFKHCFKEGFQSTHKTRTSGATGKSSGEIAYYYFYVQYGRVVRKGVLSSGTTPTSRASGEIAYHYSYLQSVTAVRKGVLSTGMTRSSRASGEIAYDYSYLQFSRAVREGVLSTGTTCSRRASGELAYHYSYSSVELWGRGSFQLVRLVQVVQVVKLHIITRTYSTIELCGRGSFQLVRLVQVVQVVKRISLSTIRIWRELKQLARF